MLAKFCMALLAAGALAFPALADEDEDEDEDERRSPRVSVCRASSKAVQGFYPGQVVSLRSRNAGPRLRHRDVLLSEAALRLLVAQSVSRRGGDDDDEDEDEGRRKVICRLDASANVFDGHGRLVQGKPVSTDQWGVGKPKPKGGPG